MINKKIKSYTNLVRGLTFDDTNGQQVNLGDTINFNSTYAWSIGCWFNIVDDADERALISKFGASDTGMLFETRKTTRFVVIEDGGAIRVQTTVGATLNAWHAVVATHNVAVGLKIYLFDAKGNLLDEVTETTSYLGSSSFNEPTRLGNRGFNGDNMDGQLAHCFALLGDIPNAMEARKFALDPPKAMYHWHMQYQPVFYFPLQGNIGSALELDFSGSGVVGDLEGSGLAVGTTLPKIYGRYHEFNRLIHTPLGVAGAIDAAPALAFSLTAALLAKGKLDAAAALAISLTSTLTARGLLDANPSLALTIVADLKAKGLLDANPALAFNVTAATNQPLIAAAQLTFTPTADLKGKGKLDAAAALQFTPVANLVDTSGGAMDANIALVLTPTANLTADGKLDAAVQLAITLTSNLTGRGLLDANPSLAFSTIAALTADGKLDAAAQLSLAITAALTADGKLDANPTLAFTLAPSLGGLDALFAAIDLTFSITSALTAKGQLSANPSLVFAPIADLTSRSALAANPALAFSGAATLLGKGALAGNPSLVFNVTPTLATINSIFANPQLSFLVNALGNIIINVADIEALLAITRAREESSLITQLLARDSALTQLKETDGLMTVTFEGDGKV